MCKKIEASPNNVILAIAFLVALSFLSDVNYGSGKFSGIISFMEALGFIFIFYFVLSIELSAYARLKRYMRYIRHPFH